MQGSEVSVLTDDATSIHPWPQLRIAVLIPCRDEAISIAAVVEGFQKAVPGASVYVYDNCSQDATAAVALSAGAIVRAERRPGKGHVVQRMFADVEADVYILVDGDGTYDAGSAPAMIDMLLHDELDMVVGTRIHTEVAAYRRGHVAGNAGLSWAVGALFGNEVKDVMSGYRVFSRRFVKSFPALTTGFETEAEFTIHALEMLLPVGQLDTPYGQRPQGANSKLRTYSDGSRIFRTILRLTKQKRPLMCFTVVCVALATLSVGLALPVFVEFSRTGLVPRLPTAVLSTGIMLLAFLALVCGLILDSVAEGRREAKRMAYLAVPAPALSPEAQWSARR